MSVPAKRLKYSRQSAYGRLSRRSQLDNRNETPKMPQAECVRLLHLLLLAFAVGKGDFLKADPGIELPMGRPSLSMDNMAGSHDSDLGQLIDAKLNESASRRTMQTQELLSRKRRYLVFPEGSSFQVVYDEYICVVDYTNYLVLGITVALAWELPSKPPSEALDDLLNKLEDGTIDVSRNDTISNITYSDDQKSTKSDASGYRPTYISLSHGSGGTGGYNSYYSESSMFRPPMHPSYKYADSYYRRPTAPARRKDNHYYYSSPASSMRNPFLRDWQSSSPAQTSRYPYWALTSHLKDSWRKGTNSGNKDQRPMGSQHSPKQAIRRHHKIYPVFGKRSLPDAADPHRRHRRSGVSSVPDAELSRLENIQIKYHRNSRQTLYGRIEKYLNKRGHNGHQCVLRTLCETGQKSTEQEPGSFVGELLRAIFTIPEALDHEPVTYQDTHYDKAHAQEGDCAALYPECKHSIWEAPFVQ